LLHYITVIAVNKIIDRRWQVMRWYRDGAGNTVEENSGVFSSQNVLVAVSKGMWVVKLCSNKILQFLTGCAD